MQRRQRDRFLIVIVVVLVLVIGVLPILPVKVAPAVTVRVVDGSGKAVTGLVVVQYWNHFTYESVDAVHTTEEVSHADGKAAFSAKTLHVSFFRLVLGWLYENVFSFIDVHGSHGVRSSFVVDGYKSEPFVHCWIDCKDNEPIVVVGDKVE